MAITHLAGQVIKETASARRDNTITADHAYDGLIAAWIAGTATDTQNGKGAVGLASASTSDSAGIIQNVSGANLTSSPGPGLDADGTKPGADDVTMAKRGRVLVLFDTTDTNAVGDPVVAKAGGLGITKAAPVVADTVVGKLISALVPITSRTNRAFGLVDLSL